MTIAPGFETEPTLHPRPISGTDIRVFPVGFDGSVLGWVTGPDRAREVLGRFGELGGDLISTADHYAAGRSEIMIGEWLRTVSRESVTVATKVGRHPDHPGLTRSAIRVSVTESLERLKTDYIDVLSFDGELLPADPRESLDAVAELISDGHVRHLSVAHFSAARLRELQEFAVTAGLPPIRTALAEYNLMHRTEFENELVPAARELGVSLIARLPLASGFLSGEVRSKTDLPANPLFDGALKHVGRKGFRVLDVLSEIAALRGSSLASVALAWLLGRTGVTAAIVRIHDLDSLSDGMIGAAFPLTRHESLLLDEASA
jgi:aryl-alcohol dehydrogenase-like predicted oxidoreductase